MMKIIQAILITFALTLLFLATIACLEINNETTSKWRELYDRMFATQTTGVINVKKDAARQLMSELSSLSHYIGRDLGHERDEVDFWTKVTEFEPRDCTLAHEAILDERYASKLPAVRGASCPYLLAYLVHVKELKLDYCIGATEGLVKDAIRRIPAEKRQLLMSFEPEERPSTNVLDKVARYFKPFYKESDRADMLTATARIYNEHLSEACDAYVDAAEQVKRIVWYLDATGAISRVDPLVGEFVRLEKMCYIIPKTFRYLASVALANN